MTRWLVISGIYAVMFGLSGKFDTIQAIGGGMFIGAISVVAIKLFGLDKDR